MDAHLVSFNLKRLPKKELKGRQGLSILDRILPHCQLTLHPLVNLLMESGRVVCASFSWFFARIWRIPKLFCRSIATFLTRCPHPESRLVLL